MANEYKQHMDQLMLLVRLAGSMDIDLDVVERTHSMADAVGPLLHPSEWMKDGAKNLDDQREVIDAALPFIRSSRSILEKHGAARG